MIFAAAALLLQAGAGPIPQVEIVTAASEVVVTGTEGLAAVTVESSSGTARPIVSTSAGTTRIRDANESLRRIGATYRIAVPRSARMVVRVRCVVEQDMPCPNAKVRIENVASVGYESVDGNAVISGIRGDVTAESLYGTVDVRDAGGRVSASSETNAVRVTRARGSAVIRSVTGMIYLESLTGGANVTNTTGEIRLSGEVGASARYELSTDIGHIRLALAEGSNATIEVNAPPDAVRIYASDARTSQRDSRRRTIVIGNGSTKVSARTLNGAVDIGNRSR